MHRLLGLRCVTDRGSVPPGPAAARAPNRDIRFSSRLAFQNWLGVPNEAWHCEWERAAAGPGGTQPRSVAEAPLFIQCNAQSGGVPRRVR
jgi:hypothetical protein